MAFRYINPGYASLLDANSGATEMTGTTYSKSGVAFYSQDSTYTKGITLENFSFEKDFWMMFDFYLLKNSGAAIFVYVPGGKKNGIKIENSPTYGTPKITLYACHNSGEVSSLASATGADDVIKEQLGIKVNAINTALLHVKYGAAGTGYIELSINNQKNWKYQEQEIGYTSTNKKVVFYTNDWRDAFSNVIISDEEISPREKIISLPISATATDMTADTNGMYIANAANQTLMQTPDVAALIAEYGTDSTITGIAVVGKPAYKTATGITTLTALSNSLGTLTEHDSCTLSDDISATALSGWRLENTTIADLQNMQFGWKAGE